MHGRVAAKVAGDEQPHRLGRVQRVGGGLRGGQSSAGGVAAHLKGGQEQLGGQPHRDGQGEQQGQQGVKQAAGIGAGVLIENEPAPLPQGVEAQRQQDEQGHLDVPSQGGEGQHRPGGGGQTEAAPVQAVLVKQENQRQPGGHGNHIQVAKVNNEQVAEFKSHCPGKSGQGMEGPGGGLISEEQVHGHSASQK